MSDPTILTQIDLKEANQAQRESIKTSKRQLPNIKVSDALKGIRVLGVVADNSACGYYRIINPLHMLRTYGAVADYSSDKGLAEFWNYDVIILPRQHNKEVLEAARFAAWEGKIVIYEIDDDLHHVLPSSPAYFSYHPGAPELKQIPEFISACHGFTTTTPEIARWYYQHNQNVAICENYIDFSFRDWNVNVQWDSGHPIIKPLPPRRIPGTEGKIVIGWSGGSCYDDQTEVLTEFRGFQLFKNLDRGEKVATLNRVTGCLEYQQPTEYFDMPFDGMLHIVETGDINFAVTPNHWMYVSQAHNLTKKKLSFSTVQAENLSRSNYHVKRDASWGGQEREYFLLPSIKEGRHGKILPEKRIPMNQWLRFLGFWVAEGYTSKKLKHVGIVQTKDNGLLDEMEALLRGWGFHPRRSKAGTELRIFSKQLWSYLSPLGESISKSFPSEVLQLSGEQIRIALNAFIEGDGTVDGLCYGKTRAWTSSPVLADQLVEMALKTGWAANVSNRGQRRSQIQGREVRPTRDNFEIRFARCEPKHHRLQPLIRAKDHKRVPYKGNIYCVTVPNHLLYVRRKGKSFWCGNTHQEDLLQIGKALYKALTNRDDTLLAMYCSVDAMLSLKNKFNLPEDKIIHIPARHFLDHPGGMHGIDIGLAPLVNCQFNLAKSHLKVLEGMAANTAMIASNVGPYARLWRRHPGSFDLVGKADHCQRTWDDAILSLIEDPDRLREQKIRGRQLAISNYSLERNVYAWPNAWKAIAERTSKGIIGPPTEVHPSRMYETFGRVDRSEACPCGSGQEYSKCCVEAWG